MQLTVKNFQSIADATLQLEGLTVITGPSDRGKSGLVRALSGVLFNLPGEHFVRTGATYAEVTLTFDRHTITWRKGGGKNEFIVDGATFGKAGKVAPEAVRALGFREELIGARLVEDETTGVAKPDGGEWMRPQIAGQFDGIFLLDKPGTFVNETIIKISRLGVLQRATRMCSLDHRGTRSRLKTRREDLDVATRRAEALADAPRLRARLDALLQLDDEVDVARKRVLVLRDLVTQRRAAERLAALALPDVDADRVEAVTRAVQDHQTLVRVRASIVRRAQLRTVPTALPPRACAPDGPEAQALTAAMGRWTALQSLVGGRVMRVTALDVAERAYAQAAAKVDAAAAAVRTFMAENPSCPVCARPWVREAAGV